METPIYGFGPHLMVDCYECNSDQLEDVYVLTTFIQEVITKIDMTPLGDPVFHILAPGQTAIASDYGVTGFCVFMESHMSLHTFPYKRFMVLDVFSCKPFDQEVVLSLVSTYFSPITCDVHMVSRGKKFPRG